MNLMEMAKHCGKFDRKFYRNLWELPNYRLYVNEEGKEHADLFRCFSGLSQSNIQPFLKKRNNMKQFKRFKSFRAEDIFYFFPKIVKGSLHLSETRRVGFFLTNQSSPHTDMLVQRQQWYRFTLSSRPQSYNHTFHAPLQQTWEVHTGNRLDRGKKEQYQQWCTQRLLSSVWSRFIFVILNMEHLHCLHSRHTHTRSSPFL